MNNYSEQAFTKEKIQKTKTKLYRKIRRLLPEQKAAKLAQKIEKAKELSFEEKSALLQSIETIKSIYASFPDTE